MFLAGYIALALLLAAPALGEPRRLSRAEAARLAAERNLTVLAARLAAERAARLGAAAYRDYVPTLELSSAYDDGASFLDPDERERALEYRGRVEWPTPVGTVVGAQASGQERVEGLTPETASAALTLKQPLLEGIGAAGAGTPLAEAEIEARAEGARFRAALEALLVEVDDAYWDLAFAQADVAVKTRSRERARQQYEDTRENIRRGILAEGNVYIVEENVVFFEQQIREAGERLDLARHRLARLLHLEPDAPLESADPLAFPEDRALPAAADAEHAGITGNPGLAARALELEKQRARVAQEENRVLPRLDLEGRLGVEGFGDRAWEEVRAADRPEGRLGVTFAMPLTLGPDRAGAEAARVEARRLEAEMERIRAEVRFDVRDRLAEIASLLDRLRLARRRAELAGLKLQAEQQKYQAGLATLADVVQFQRDIDEAAIGLDRVQRDLLTRWSRLLAAQGALHPSLGIELE